MTEIKRHELEELYNSYFRTSEKDGLRMGAKTSYTLFERHYDLDGREMLEPQKMIAIRQEGNVVILFAEDISRRILRCLSLAEWGAEVKKLWLAQATDDAGGKGVPLVEK